MVLVKEGGTIWQRSIANRVLFTITAGLVFWPWISSVVLAGLSFILPRETVEQAWTVPFWTVLQIPMGVTGLMLVHYYQRTNTAPGYRGTS